MSPEYKVVIPYCRAHALHFNGVGLQAIVFSEWRTRINCKARESLAV